MDETPAPALCALTSNKIHLHNRITISGRGSNTRDAPANRIIPAIVAQSACETNQIAQKPPVKAVSRVKIRLSHKP
jgi:hypothetical protein